MKKNISKYIKIMACGLFILIGFNQAQAQTIHFFGGLDGTHFIGDKSIPEIGLSGGVAYQGYGGRSYMIYGSYYAPSYYNSTEEAYARNPNVPVEAIAHVRHITNLAALGLGSRTFLVDIDCESKFNIYYDAFAQVLFGNQYDRVMGLNPDDYNIQTSATEPILTDKSKIFGIMTGIGLGLEYKLDFGYIFLEPYADLGAVAAMRNLSGFQYGFKLGIHHKIDL